MQKSAFSLNPSPTFGYDPFETISKSGENIKSPDFAKQSGRLFGLSLIQGKRVSVIPAIQVYGLFASAGLHILRSC